jgi:hypothetical protein
LYRRCAYSAAGCINTALRFFFLPVTQDLGLTRASTSLCLPANAVRAKLVERAEEWRWSSAYRAVRQDVKLTDFLSPWPMERPQNWIELVNESDKHRGSITND